jgi:dihydroorotate dehydrogenase electron transfer subunit
LENTNEPRKKAPKFFEAQIARNTKIAPGIFDMSLDIKPWFDKLSIIPGQFIEIYTGRPDMLLPRPISVCDVDVGALRIIYRTVGQGTQLLSRKCPGELLRIMLPCGNGYSIQEAKSKPSILVGGGIGTPPLLFLAKRIREMSPKANITAVIGFRSDVFLEDDFRACCDSVFVATDDGSVGYHGNAVELIRKKHLDGNFYACGPKPMLKNLAYNTESTLQVSLEERMACGIGACLGCVVLLRDKDSFSYKKICSDGPVFDSKQIVWEAML